jgi:amino acid permease
MFSPQSVQMDQLNKDPFLNDSSDINEEEVNANLSNDIMAYGVEEININRSNTASSESNISYCGIKGNSVLSGILNICSSAIGAGCLTFPFIIANLGIIYSAIIFIILVSCIYFTIGLLRSFVVDTKYFSYSYMTETILGKKWLMIYSVSSFLFYSSINTNYITLLYSIFKSTLVSHAKLYGFTFLLITCSIEIFLCLYTSKPRKVNILSLITMLSFTILVLVTVTNGILSSLSLEHLSKKFASRNLFNPGNGPIFFPSVTACIKFIYAYSYHSSFPTFMGNLKNPNDQNINQVHHISFIIITVSYVLIALFGYLLKDQVSIVLFREYEDTNERDAATLIIKYILFLFLFSLIPNRYIIIRDGYTCLVGKHNLTYKKDLLITTLGLILTNCIVYVNEEFFVYEGHIQIDVFSIMVNMFGGIFGVLITFGLPVINYAAANGKRKLKSLVGYAMTGVFLIVGLLSFGYSFYEMFFTNKSDEEDE